MTLTLHKSMIEDLQYMFQETFLESKHSKGNMCGYIMSVCSQAWLQHPKHISVSLKVNGESDGKRQAAVPEHLSPS